MNKSDFRFSLFIETHLFTLMAIECVFDCIRTPCGTCIGCALFILPINAHFWKYYSRQERRVMNESMTIVT